MVETRSPCWRAQCSPSCAVADTRTRRWRAESPRWFGLSPPNWTFASSAPLIQPHRPFGMRQFEFRAALIADERHQLHNDADRSAVRGSRAGMVAASLVPGRNQVAVVLSSVPRRPSAAATGAREMDTGNRQLHRFAV